MARVALALMVAAGAACGSRPITIPTSPIAPLTDPATALRDARQACLGVRTLTAEVAVSGRSGDRRLRGRLHVGVAEPASMRLEAVAPFGPPVFVLAARRDLATLLFPREDRAVEGAPAPDVVEAIAGVPLGAGDLRAVLSGCFTLDDAVTGGRSYAKAWSGVTLSDGSDVFLKDRQLRIGAREGLTIEYGEFELGLPRRLRIVSRQTGDRAGTDLALRLSQLDTNVPIDPRAFELRVPDTAERVTLDEIRREGPLGVR